MFFVFIGLSRAQTDKLSIISRSWPGSSNQRTCGMALARFWLRTPLFSVKLSSPSSPQSCKGLLAKMPKKPRKFAVEDANAGEIIRCGRSTVWSDSRASMRRNGEMIGKTDGRNLADGACGIGGDRQRKKLASQGRQVRERFRRLTFESKVEKCPNAVNATGRRSGP